MPLENKQYLQVNQALFSLSHAYERKMEQDRPKNILNLSMADCSTLMVLQQFGHINARQLSEAMDINPGTISVYVNRLVKKGLLVRKRDTNDRRTWWLTLTPAGKMASRKVLDNAVQYTQSFLESLEDDEQQELHRLLLKASHALGFQWQ
ncbi:MAG: MarR family transcriptional regulator [Anaerolineales bacterium]|nr:MarR family transcriptional regulator [Anaerolineales bacterium]